MTVASDMVDNLVAGNQTRADAAAEEKLAKERQKQFKGLTTTGLILVTWLRKVVRESKIVSAVLGTLTKLIGLLVDLILLPLLPLLISALLFLADTIMKIPGIGPAAVETPGVTAGKEIGGKGALGIDIPSLIAIISGALLGALLIITAAGILGVSVGPLAIALSAIFLGILSYILVQLGYKWGDWFGSWLRMRLWETTTWFGKVWDSFLKGVDNAVKWAKDGFVNLFLLFVEKIADIIDLFRGALNVVGDWWKGVMSGGWIPHLQSGGSIAETGVAVVHKGETVTPAGSKGDIHLHITGTLFRNEEELYTKVVDKLRKDQWRYNA
jgi:hypothetical protein